MYFSVTSKFNGTPKSVYANSVKTRIQRDLNSPSASARVRANKALNSSTFLKATYEVFDVQHEAQDIITAEERKSFKPKTMKDIFANCKIYVEVRTGDDNRSFGIKNRLIRDGITINEKLYKDTTHVIFKDGLLSTYKNAMKMGIPVTTILWIDACQAQLRLVDTAKFKISNLDRYEHPELYKRLRREKSMQPKESRLTAREILRTIERSLTQDDTRNDTKYFENEVILQDYKSFDINRIMELTLQNETNQTPKKDNYSEKFKQKCRRHTTFTPNLMEQTELTSNDNQKTYFTPQLSQKTEKETPTLESFSSGNSGRTIIFNSSNRIAKSSRRSILDISMNILDINCKSMVEKKEESPLLLSKKKETQNSLLKFTLTQSLKSTTARKRKLFNEDYEHEEYKENVNESLNEPLLKKRFETPESKKSATIIKKITQSADRRKTLTYFKPQKPKEKESLMTKPKPSIQPASVKHIVCTNMSATDKQIIQAV